MTRTAELAAINCTSCGAGLDVLGGGRVRVHICPYCGAELDAQDDYKVLRQYANMPRPDSPFRVGMTGALFDVDWTIIGTIGKTEAHLTWVEHQLYSPTHGYAWLVVDRGHMTFARRVRRTSTPPWMSEAWVESAEKPPGVRLNGDYYRYYETSDAEVTFLEGEFTWAPRKGDRGRTISSMSNDAMLDFSNTGLEREMYRSVYLDPQVTAAAFGLEEVDKPSGMHPLLPYQGGRNDRFMTRAAGFFALLCILALVGLATTGTKRTVFPEQVVPLLALPRSVTFDVADVERLVRVDLFGNPVNSWSFVEMEVIDPEEETLFETGRAMEYYNGRDSEGAWTEGRRDAQVRFRPTIPGTYTLVFHETEHERWISSGRPATQVRVTIDEGVRTSRWLLWLAMLFGISAIIPMARRWLHNARRWSGSDWNDD